MRADDLILPTPEGLYVPEGGFYIDPMRVVERAVVTHAHGDHAKAGAGSYLTSARGEHVLRARVGTRAEIQTLAWGERKTIGGVTVSLHPSGHVLGACQVRLEPRGGGRVTVVSGDYKVQADPTTEGFEAVKCDTFVTETTFALPVYRWRPPEVVFGEINQWWRENAREGLTSVILAYAFGKAQRLLAGVDASIGPIAVHSTIAEMNKAYALSGVVLPQVLTGDKAVAARGKGLVITPSAAPESGWIAGFGELAVGVASGWMQLGAARERQVIGRGRGFVLSDHADWPGLLEAIAATGASRVLATHGHTAQLVRYLREKGLDAQVLK
jgi:putative mRNA 3-end processing factor